MAWTTSCRAGRLAWHPDPIPDTWNSRRTVLGVLSRIPLFTSSPGGFSLSWSLGWSGHTAHGPGSCPSSPSNSRRLGTTHGSLCLDPWAALPLTTQGCLLVVRAITGLVLVRLFGGSAPEPCLPGWASPSQPSASPWAGPQKATGNAEDRSAQDPSPAPRSWKGPSGGSCGPRSC